MKKKLLLTSLLLILTLSVVGCKTEYMNLRGQVTDRFTGQALAGVQVEVGNRLVETNAHGYFIVKNIPVVDDLSVKDRMLKVSAPGYRVYAQPLTLQAGDKKVKIGLESRRETKFFFVSDQSDSKSIYLTDIYGNQVTKLTDDKGDDWAPDWSANKRKVVFLSNRAGNSNIYTMDAGGSNLKQITYTTTNKQTPIWVGDNSILFASNRDGDYDLYLTNLAGSFLRRLTDNNHYDGQAAYSAKRAQIAYISATTGKRQLHLMKITGDRKLLLNKGLGVDQHPTWSYKEDKILFTTSSTGKTVIKQINPNGSGLQSLFKTRERIYDYALWDTKERLILYVTDGEDSKDLKLYTSNNQRDVLVAEDINYLNPEWKEEK
ncbi:periplasmic component of the Tol biopolymer transport system [Halobacteroides halobius DSM 5150]|uniref:Periplasmic component of the Tol biopolymer transport system n=1 Tax=Halobacteroides halobius (strain ATCC 35273 / DSM 5150 / MD-1) TaxID=748449 RepID=L0KA97_HALHC|nr:PD40 domain-containing protein [Halobacteroides halobius]AGB42232.1 periplasmic component of the Tol biopolymer transport system [Halobacteroides halobius DSM 5150]